jgi:hypothetical protein
MSVEFDLDAFQIQVLRQVERLQKLENEVEPFYQTVRQHYPDSKNDRVEGSGCLGLIPRGLIKFIEVMGLSTARSLRRHRLELTQRAKNIAEQKEVKLHLCPALRGVENSPVAIAKTMTPILVPLAGAKIICLPLEPELFAMLALVITRNEIADYCTGY